MRTVMDDEPRIARRLVDLTVVHRALLTTLLLANAHCGAFFRLMGTRRFTSIAAADDPDYLADKLVGHLGIKLEDKQSLLEGINPAERLERILG